MCRPVGASSGLLTPRRPLPWLGFPVFPAHPAAFLWTAHFDRLAAMHLLYLDDAGSVGNVREQYLVLGGVSVFEAQSSWVTQQLDRLAQNIDPGNPHALEFHVEAGPVGGVEGLDADGAGPVCRVSGALHPLQVRCMPAVLTPAGIRRRGDRS